MRPAACLLAILLTAAAVSFSCGPSLAKDAAAAAAAPLPNPMCPVLTDEPADPEIHVDWEGRRVYLCCNRCRKQFLAEPAKYAGNLPPLAAEDGGRADRRAAAPRAADGNLTTAQRLVRFAGRFHPATVHFPIALLGVGAALELAAWLLGAFGAARRSAAGHDPRAAVRGAAARLADAARVIVPLGAAAALVAMSLGLANEAFASFPRELHDAVETHETMGIATAVGAVTAAALSWLAGRRGGRWVLLYRVVLLIVAAMVAGTGYLGGVLVYGPDHYAW